MLLQKLEVRDFRTYAHACAEFPDGVSILHGSNAQGKTNALEAVFLLSGSRSWRVRSKVELIAFGTERASVRGEVAARDRTFDILQIIPRAGRETITVNGVRRKTRGELCDLLRCVLFSPDDLGLVRDGAAARRRFLDTALCQLRPRYDEVLSEYHRLLEQKSRILKADEGKRPQLLSVLPEYNARMARLGSLVIRFRARYFALLAPACAEIYRELAAGSGEALSLRYQTVSSVTDPFSEQQTERELLRHAEEHFAAELSCGQCLSGPHKDDIVLEIDGRDAKAYASQGQTRSVALALKFAEREMFFRDGGEYPLLLLDDVLSELDARRQAFVTERVAGGQTLLTSAGDAGAVFGTSAALFCVSRGSIERTR